MSPQLIQGALEGFRDYFNRSTRELQEEHSNFAPAEGMFTAAGQVAHAAQTIEWFLAGAFSPAGFDMDFERMDQEVRGCRSLAHAREWFNRAIDKAKAAAVSHSEAEWLEPLPPGPIMGGLPRELIIGAINDHTAHHRGALTVYTRLLGKVPPMPYMET